MSIKERCSIIENLRPLCQNLSFGLHKIHMSLMRFHSYQKKRSFVFVLQIQGTIGLLRSFCQKPDLNHLV